MQKPTTAAMQLSPSLLSQQPKRVTGIKSHEQGMATVEFAIIGAVFILLLIGIMQLGLGIYYRNHVANVAREAARYAALHGSSAPTPATTSSVRNVVLARSNTLVDTSKISVTTTWIPNNDSGSVVRVRVQYPYPITIPFIPSQTLQLQSTSEMIIF